MTTTATRVTVSLPAGATPDEQLDAAGLDPEAWEIVQTVSIKQSRDGDIAFTLLVRERPESTLRVLYRTARKQKLRYVKRSQGGRGLVVLWADLQYGKTDHRGGTPELVERLARIRVELEATLRVMKPEQILVADLGDPIEGFENTGSQSFTNDRSLPGQLDGAATELWLLLQLCERHCRGGVSVLTVPSNHGAWRNGPQRLGKPSDDFGLMITRQVEKLAYAAGYKVAFHYPDPWSETVAVDFMGHRIAATHGHQARGGSFGEWFGQQIAGGTALAGAEVILSGHYHSLVQEQIGRLANGAPTWHVQATTLDSGSSWWTNSGGQGDSDAGLTVLEVAGHGFDVGSVRVLYGRDVDAA